MQNQTLQQRRAATRVRPKSNSSNDAGLAGVIAASRDLLSHIVANVNTLVGGVRRDSQLIAEESEALYLAALDRLIFYRAALQSTPRFTRIVRAGARLIATYKLFAQTGALLSEDARALELSALHRDNAKRVASLCLELRGGVLKLGQFISCRMDLLPPEYVDELALLHDRVPAIPTSEIRELVESELGKPLADVFASFEDQPIGAASLAQVHGAKLHDGTDVAVKVRVPGVEALIDVDLAAMRVIAGILGDLLPKFDLATIVSELSQSIALELDFRREADNAREFASHFSSSDRVVVPAVIDQFCTARVLTLTRSRGQRLADYLRASDAPARDDILGLLFDSFARQILAHGLFHGDPHPGNFLVEYTDGIARLVILDFGSVKRCDQALRQAYAQIVGAAVTRDAAQMARLLEKIGFRTKDGNSAVLLEFADMVLAGFTDDGVTDFSAIDPRKQMARALELARKNPVIEIPGEFVLLARVITSLGGLALHYQPHLNMFAILAPHLATALAANDDT